MKGKRKGTREKATKKSHPRRRFRFGDRVRCHAGLEEVSSAKEKLGLELSFNLCIVKEGYGRYASNKYYFKVVFLTLCEAKFFRCNPTLATA